MPRGMLLRTAKKPSPSPSNERPDIDTYTQAQSATQQSNLHALTVSPDGTKLYIANTSNLYQYSMTSGDLSTLSLVRSISFNSRWLDITSDGSNLYSIKDWWQSGNGYVTRLALSTDWDISTATATTNTNWNLNFVWCYIKDDLSRLYRGCNDDSAVPVNWTFAYQADLTNGDITGTLNWVQGQLQTITQDGHSYRKVYDIKISPTWRKLFACQHYTNSSYWMIAQYTLSTPWDVTTATYDNKNLVIPTSSRWGFDVDENWNLYAVAVWGNTIYKYVPPTPSTPTVSYDFTTQDVLTFKYKQNGYTGYGWTQWNGYYSYIQSSSYYRTNTIWGLPSTDFWGTLNKIRLTMDVPNLYSGGWITTSSASQSTWLWLGAWDSNTQNRMKVWNGYSTYEYSTGIQTLVIDLENAEMYIEGNNYTHISLTSTQVTNVRNAWNNQSIFFNAVANLPNGSGVYTYLRWVEIFTS